MNFFDLHCDTPYECYIKNQKFCKNNLSVSGCKGNGFENWFQTFAVWIKDDIENPYRLYKNIISDFKCRLKEKPENLVPVFSVEGGALLEDKKERLYELKNDGITMLTLTWNGENRIAGGSKSDKGLTSFGREVISLMNNLKIACDLSHLNAKSYFPALEETAIPIATHSNCRQICKHPRNLTDEQIKLLCEKGGIIGLCPYPEFLGGDVVDKIYENISHICDMGFEDNIAFGSDFDGAEQAEILRDISKIPKFYIKLREKGLNERLLNKFFYINAHNFIAKLG